MTTQEQREALERALWHINNNWCQGMYFRTSVKHGMRHVSCCAKGAIAQTLSVRPSDLNRSESAVELISKLEIAAYQTIREQRGKPVELFTQACPIAYVNDQLGLKAVKRMYAIAIQSCKS